MLVVERGSLEEDEGDIRLIEKSDPNKEDP